MGSGGSAPMAFGGGLGEAAGKGGCSGSTKPFFAFAKADDPDFFPPVAACPGAVAGGLGTEFFAVAGDFAAPTLAAAALTGARRMLIHSEVGLGRSLDEPARRSVG